jgi:hypothetical protein
MTEQDETMLLLCRHIAELVDTGVSRLPPATRDLIAAAIDNGSTLMLLSVLTPKPQFICMLSHGKDSQPTELFRCAPDGDSLRLLTLGRDGTVSH